MAAQSIAVRQVSGSRMPSEADRFHIVVESQLEETTTAFAFAETGDLTEAEVVQALEQQGHPPRNVAEALRAARTTYSSVRRIRPTPRAMPARVPRAAQAPQAHSEVSDR